MEILREKYAEVDYSTYHSLKDKAALLEDAVNVIQRLTDLYPDKTIRMPLCHEVLTRAADLGVGGKK